jgi:hypothetical protein
MKRVLLLVLPWLALLAVGGLALALRYGLVESADVAHACDTARTLACDMRHKVVLGFILAPIFGYQMGIYGWVALASAALALAWKHPFSAWLSATTGVVALILYCFAPGAFALLVGCLRLVRVQAMRATPLDQHRTGGRQAHA